MKNWLILAGLAVLLFGLRLAAPSNLMDNDQERPAAYVLDAVLNGHWSCQRDYRSDISSKPPLYTWIAAVVTRVTGQVSLTALYAPAFLATLGVAWLLYGVGRAGFGERAGMAAALAYLVSYVGAKQIALARTDGLFAFLVTAAALLAFRAWRRQGGWTWFWLVAAFATLTKGPLGVALAAAGLLAVWWEKGPRLKGTHWPGVLLFLALTLGWFAWAYAEYGTALTQKMLGRELVGHALRSDRGKLPGTGFFEPTLFFLARFAPWSLAGIVGLWRVWKQPAADDLGRQLERFLWCWFMVGLVIFSLSPHQRGDLLFPLIPAGALLAGRELARWAKRWMMPVAVAVGLALIAVNYLVFVPRQPKVQQTMALQEFARQLEDKKWLLTHMDAPYTLQFFAGTRRAYVPVKDAQELLQGDAAAYVVVAKRAALDTATVSEVARGPGVWVLSNRPTWPDDREPVVFQDGTLRVRLAGTRILRQWDGWLDLYGNTGQVEANNLGSTPQRFSYRAGRGRFSSVIGPGETGGR